MDVIACCAFGVNVDSDSIPDHPIVSNAKKIIGMDALLSQAICLTLPSVARLLRLEPFDPQSSAYFDQLTFTVIEKRLKDSSKQSKKPSSLDSILNFDS